MHISQIISKSRIQTNTSTAQKTDQQMLDDLNIIQDNIFSTLGTTQKKYAWTYWNTNTVANQEEYKLPVEDITNNYPGLIRLMKIYVDYGNGFVKAKIYSQLPDFKDNIIYSENNPLVVNSDGSYFVYPTPKQAIIGGLKVEGTYRPLPLTITDQSEDIKLSPENHDILLYGLNMMNYQDKQLREQANFWEGKYEVKMKDLTVRGAMDTDGPYNETDNTSLLNVYS